MNEHPTQRLCFSSVDVLPPSSDATVRAVMEEVVSSRRWSLGPPTWRVESGQLSGELELHCAYPPGGDQLPLETDEQEFEQTSALIGALERLSVELHSRIDLTLDDDDIGSVEAGAPDSGITETLLAEWKRVLLAKRGTIM